jgi:hypothetical protein
MDKTSIEVEGFIFGPEESDEVKLVKLFNKILDIKINHLSLPANWPEIFYEYFHNSFYFCDGEESASYYSPIFYAYEFKQKYFDFAFNGLGGELYRDFWWLQELYFSKRPANLKKLIKTRVLQYEYDYSIFSEKFIKCMQNDINIFLKHYQKTINDMDLHNTYNTQQIENIYFRQKIRKWAGRTISTSNLFLPTIAPLTFKNNLNFAMQLPPKYKIFGNIARELLEQIFPDICKVNMLNKTPCSSFRPSNIAKFFPLTQDISRKIIRKLSQNFFNKTILVNKALAYNQSTWFKKFIDDKKSPIRYNNMASAYLYEKNKFERFILMSKEPNFPYFGQLGNIITVELRMRNDNIQ